MSRILITGAGGFVGRAVCQSLRSAGYTLSGTTRQETKKRGPENIPMYRVSELGKDTDWSQCVVGADAIVHLAARVHVMKEKSSNPFEAYRKANRDSSVSLAEAAVKAGVKRIVFISTVKVNGEVTRNSPFIETDPPSPGGPYAVSKWEAEKSLQEVAKKHNTFVTFMPKPTIGDWRSGGHINFSLEDIKDGKNVFKDENSWSKESQFAVGGLLTHSEALTAITCPTVNSYNGLVPTVGGFEGGVHTWAPVNITYGHNNRSAQFRLPQNRFCIENRAADLTMNVYLALGMTISAAVEGIKNKIDPGKPSDIDLYSLTDEESKKLGIKRLPRNLLQAIEALKKDKLAEKVMGSVMLNSYISYKNDEWERYHQAVTDWEVKEYLRLY